MKEYVDVLIDEAKIEKKLQELAAQIDRDFHGEEIALVCVLKGGAVTLVHLAKYLKSPVTMDFLSASSYGNGVKSSGDVQIRLDLTNGIEGKNVLLVEDIVDSGRTLAKLREMFLERNPKSFRICTLLDKPDGRVVDVPVDYVGFEIPDAFVVGFGLDFAQKYRNLGYIGVVHFEEE